MWTLANQLQIGIVVFTLQYANQCELEVKVTKRCQSIGLSNFCFIS